MARGESERTTGNPMGSAILAVFAASALAALAFVVVTTRACASCDAALYGAITTGDPYVGASTAAGELGWRDAARARAAWGAPVPADPIAAAASIETSLRARGYVAAEGMTLSVARELPMELAVPELGGGCGVVEIIGEPATRLTGATAGAVRTEAADPSVMTVGACGDASIRVEGVGRATARVWHLPGLTPADEDATGLPPDALLGHAEAERVLARYGYVATSALVRVPLPSGASPAAVAPLPTPSTGCVPWVVVAVGAGRASTGVLTDHAPDRTLALAITCASRSGWEVSSTVASGSVATAWARAFRPPGSGATLPADAPSTIGAARIALDPAAIVLPPGLREAP